MSLAISIALVLMSAVLVLSELVSEASVRGHKHIALCIGGQTGRLHLRELTKWFDHDRDHSITMFFNLQNETRYSFGSHKSSASSSNFTHSNYKELSHTIHHAYARYPFVKVAKITMHSFVDEQHLKTRLIRKPSLDRIRGMKNMFYPLQTNILNMFLKQQACMHQIEQYEREAQDHIASPHFHSNLLHPGHNKAQKEGLFEFDYVICTRDDLHVFKPFALGPILDFMVANKVDVSSKNCLAWGGINERFQIFTRDAAATILGERLEYYKSAYITGKVFMNTEFFELSQIVDGDFNYTGVSVDMLPVTASRIDEHGKVCFTQAELELGILFPPPWNEPKCIPESVRAVVSRQIC